MFMSNLSFFFGLSWGDSGEYTCMASVAPHQSSLYVQSGRATLSKIIIIEIIFFQLRLNGISDCQQWVADNRLVKAMDIKIAIVNNVEQRCQYGFTVDSIQQDGFLCFSDETLDSVAYRAELHGNTGANSSLINLITIIERWITEGAVISVQALFISVDRECTVAIDSLASPELCPSPTTSPPVTTGLETVTSDMTTPLIMDTTTRSTTASVPPPGSQSMDILIIAIVVVIAVLVLIIVIAINIVIIVYFILKSRRAGLKLQVQSRDVQGIAPITLHGVSQIQPYEMVELGSHEYEDVTNYQQKTAEYEDVSSTPLHIHPPPLLPSQAPPPPRAAPPTASSQPPPTSQTGDQGSQDDYEFTDCVAYKTTTHTTAPPTATPTDLEVVYSN